MSSMWQRSQPELWLPARYPAHIRGSRAAWAEAFEQFGIPKGHTGPAEEMFEAVNAGWMDLGAEDTEHVAGTTCARDVFEAAQNTAQA